MALNPYDVMHVVESHLKVLGSIKRVQIGEPKAPPLDVLTASVRMGGIRTPSTVLDAPVRVYDVIVQLYRNALDDGTRTETEMARAVGEVMEEFDGDFTLRGNSRAVDIGGIYGPAVEAVWGNLDFGNTMMRTVEITVPIIIDPSATFENSAFTAGFSEGFA